MPVKTGAIIVCLTCNNVVSVEKYGYLKRYYETINKNLHKKFPFDSAARKNKLYAYLLS